MNKEPVLTNYFPRQSPKAVYDVRQTPVILVCINNLNGMKITHDFLYQTFTKYGNVQRILIFEKSKQWKSLIEYSGVESAMEAKKALDNNTVFNDGSKLAIFSTQIDSLKSYNIGGMTNQPGPALPQLKDFTTHENYFYNGFEVKSCNSLKEKSYNSNTSTTIKSDSSKSSKSSNSTSHLDAEREEDNDVFKMINNNQEERLSDHCSIEDEGGVGEVMDELEEQLRNNFSDKLFINPSKSTPDIKDPKDEDEVPNKRKDYPGTALNLDEFKPPGLGGPNHYHPCNRLFPIMDVDTPTEMKGNYDQNHNQKKILDMIDREIYSNIVGKVQQNLDKHNYNFGMNPPVPVPQPISVHSSSFHPMNHQQQKLKDNRKVFSMTDSMLEEKTFQSQSQSQQQQQMQPPKQVQQPSPRNYNHMNNSMPKFQQYSSPFVPKVASCTNLEQANFSMPYSNSYNNLESTPPHGKSLTPNPMTQSLTPPLMHNNRSVPSGQNTPQSNSLNSLNTTQQNGSILDLYQMNKDMQIYQGLSSVLVGVECKKSQVLYIRGLEHKDIKINMLYNIFSNFGNILKIIFIRGKAAALIEFENSDYSTISKDYLNNIVFMGKPLRIYYSNYGMINLRKNLKDNVSEDIFIGSIKNFRFKKNKNISINPPSSTLHISNLVKEVCSEDLMRKVFGSFGRVEAIKFLFMENSKNMCLLKMASLEESLNAMAYLHDTDLGGRKIQISFTRSKI